MGKNINAVLHKKSKQKENGLPKLPSSEQMLEGEIAINYANGVETISIKNENGDIVTFSSDNYYSSKYVDQVLDETKSQSTNPVSSKAVYSAITENEEIVANALTALNDAKFGYVEYDSNNKRINFYDKEISGSVISYIDATSFIKDGMVESVSIEDVTSGASQVTCLVIAFNTDSGKENINIPLSELFDPTNYYNKNEVDSRDLFVSGNGLNSVVQKGGNNVTSNALEYAGGQFNSSSSASTEFGDSGNTLFSVGNGESASERHNAFEIRQNGDIYIVRSGSTVLLQDEIGKITVDQILNDDVSASTNPIASKAVYDYASEIEEVMAIALNQLNYDLAEHSADMEKHVTTAERTYWNAKLDASAYTPTDLSNYYTKSETSGATEIATALNGLEQRKLDASAYTPTDLSNYYTKSETSGATEIATALNDLEQRKLDASAYTPTDLSNYYNKNEVDSRDLFVSGNGLNSVVQKGGNNVTSNALEYAGGQFNSSSSASTEFGNSGNTLFSIGNGQSTSARHNAFEIRQNGDIYIVRSGSTVLLQDEIGKITVDQILNDDVSASTNPIASKAVYSVIAENEKATAIAYNTLNDKKIDTVLYNDVNNTIEFYTKNSEDYSGTPLSIISGDVFTSAATQHANDTALHFSGNEKENLDSLSSNIGAISGITAAKINEWNAKADSVSSAITAMTGYSIPTSGSSITVTDTLNEAIGKLERLLTDLINEVNSSSQTISASLNDLNDRITTLENAS